MRDRIFYENALEKGVLKILVGQVTNILCRNDTVQGR